MIEGIAARNFKSLGDFKLKLGPFTCLIGMNGAGKTSILQAIDFMSQLMVGRIDDWLEMREWVPGDLVSKFSPSANIQLALSFLTEGGQRVGWGGQFNRHSLACTSENLTVDGETVLTVRGQVLKVHGAAELQGPIGFNYQGSVLSQLKGDNLPPAVLAFRDAMRKIRSLELLAPNLMRRRARSSESDIGPGGEKLSAFLDSIRGAERDSLRDLLRTFYPRLEDFKITSQRAGWKKLSVFERFGDHRIETEARHINDGLLRVLAILAQAASDRSLILLDEIENGINPEIVEALVGALLASPQQMLVTTHSPMILNYLPDDTARQALQFVYKNPAGQTRVRPFFSIDRIARKLEVMGPGEAFVDTDLEALTSECVLQDQDDEAQKLARMHASLAEQAKDMLSRIDPP